MLASDKEGEIQSPKVQEALSKLKEIMETRKKIKSIVIQNNLKSLEEQSIILTQGTTFTSAIVDMIHGKLTKQPPIDYLNCLLESLFSLCEENLEILKISTDVNIIHESWNQICQLRRIFQRISSATNINTFSDANFNEYTDVDFLQIERLNNLLCVITEEIISKSMELWQKKVEGEIYWFEFGVAYESTIILRARGNVGAAISLAEHCMKFQNIAESSKRDSELRGLISFNRNFLDYIASTHVKLGDLTLDRYSNSLEALFYLSSRISRNSKHGAIRQLNHEQWPDSISEMIPIRFLVVCVELLQQNQKKRQFRIHHSFILHLEGVLRVCAYQSCWNGSLAYAIFRRWFVGLISDSTENLEGAILSLSIDEWLKKNMAYKVKEDLGTFVSQMSPVTLAKDVQSEERNPIEFLRPYLKSWKDDRDSPVLIRVNLQRAILRDIEDRAEEIENGNQEINLANLVSFIGDHRENNPLVTRGLARFLSQGGKRKEHTHESRHMAYLPHGGFNRSQVAIFMALMQRIDRKDESLFSSKFVVNKGTNRLQFTDKPYPDKRSNLTRVNRYDEMMFLANSLNLITDAINSEFKDKKNFSKLLDTKLRECDISVLATNLKEKFNYAENKIIPHVHELFYFAEEASTSPMRFDESISGYTDKTEGVLRVGFARIYCLSLRTENLARFLLSKPLREPFLGSCVLLVEQIRAHLKLIHEEWLQEFISAEKVSKFEALPNIEHLHNLLELKNSKRKNIFDNVKSRYRANEDNKGSEVMPDVAVEYQLGTCLTKENYLDLISESYSRLNFSKNLGGQWDSLFHRRAEIRSESLDYHEYKSLVNLRKLFSDDGFLERIDANDQESLISLIDGEMPPADDFDLRVINALDTIKMHSDREWIYWLLLSSMPDSFVGRVMVSANTPRDLNREENVKSHPLLSKKFQSILYELDEDKMKSLNEVNSKLSSVD